MLVKALLSTCLLSLSFLAVAQTQTERNLGVLDDLDRSRDILQTTEDDLGRYHMGLVEPLEQLADQLMSLNQFDEADDMLDRAVQITRINDGLHTPVQLSLIKKRIDNFSNRQAWDDAREWMEYLFSYYLRIPVLLNENLLDDFLILTEQHLRGVTEAPEEEQGFHFYRALQLNWAMITTARKLYGENTPELVPYLYRQVRHFYANRKIHDNVGVQRSMLRRSLRDFSRRDRMVGQMKRVEIERVYYIQGLALFDEIGRSFALTDPPNQVAQAMTELYLADWMNLFDYADDAAQTYENAYQSLIDSGVSEDQLNILFSEPRLLPLEEFHSSVEMAFSQLSAGANELQVSDGESSATQITLREWSPDIPTARPPLSAFQRSDEDLTYAQFLFDLAAENETTWLYSHQYSQSIGAASEEGLIRGFREIDSGNDEALERLDQLRFRPKLVDGVLTPSQVLLRYEMAIKDE